MKYVDGPTIEFVTPVYNAGKYVVKCIESVIMQTNDKWKMHIINDASTDNTLEIIMNTISKYPHLRNKFNIINNTVNKKALYNINNTIKTQCDNSSIIALLDGDDWLYSPHIIEMLLNKYIKQDLWIIWTQHIHYPSMRMGGSGKIIKNDVRKSGAAASHFRTFRKQLYDHIKVEDLQDDNGDFYEASYDVAMMLPMLEMAGSDKRRFFNNISYVYNRETPLNDDKLRKNQQQDIAKHIRAQTPYRRIRSL